MNLVTIENLTKQYSERVLLDSAELRIDAGDRIGLIGRNGSGKTTLLRLVAGEETTDNGTVTIWGNVRVQYLPQNPPLDPDLTVLATLYRSSSPQMQLLLEYETVNRAIATDDSDSLQDRYANVLLRMDAEDGWTAESKAKTILTKLGITQFGAKIATLSGGQQKRVALARALLDPADLLILDEPTNHIDADTIEWLEKYLASEVPALFMVTHDRYFLDRVANQIVELDRRELIKYPGNYTTYLDLRAKRHEELSKQEEKRRTQLRRELEWLRRSPSARGTKQKARKQRATELMTIKYDKNEDRVAMLLASRRLGKTVLEAENLSVAFDGKTLFSGVDFKLEPNERIGIVGPNGAGKSTLLNLLAGKLNSPTGSINWGETVTLGYYDQQAERLDDSMRIIDFIERELPLIYSDSGERVEAAQMLQWFLFTRPEQRAKIGSLSGGERRRLYLLSVLMHRPNVLFLDEPTNDLDIQTLQVLEQFLDNFGGSLVTVSHDRYFLDRNVDFIYVFDENGIGSRYPSPYRPQENEQASGASKQVKKAVAKKAEPVESSGTRKLTWKEQRELEALEEEIEQLEAQKQAIWKLISQPMADHQEIRDHAIKNESILARLEEAEMRWLELSELAG